jgi:hypothetical protein
MADFEEQTLSAAVGELEFLDSLKKATFFRERFTLVLCR